MINKVPYKEDIIGLNDPIYRFLRFHEFKFCLEDDPFCKFDLMMLYQLEMLNSDSYSYNVEDAVIAYGLLKDLISQDCSDVEEFQCKVAELAKYFLLVNLHLQIFWRRHTLEEVFRTPWKHILFFHPDKLKERDKFLNEIQGEVPGGYGTFIIENEKKIYWFKGSDLKNGVLNDEVDTTEIENDHYYISFGKNGKLERVDSDDFENLEQAYKDARLLNSAYEKDFVLDVNRLRFLGSKAQLEFIFKSLMYDSVLQKGFLNHRTTLDDFKSIFLPGQYFRKTQWNTTDQHCAFFIRELQDKRFIKTEHKAWEKGQNCFLNEKGSPIKNLYNANRNSDINQTREPFIRLTAIIVDTLKIK